MNVTTDQNEKTARNADGTIHAPVRIGVGSATQWVDLKPGEGGYADFDAFLKGSEAEDKRTALKKAALKARAAKKETHLSVPASGTMTMPDGSYPISDVGSLRAAIALSGRSKTYSAKAVKAHILKAAAKLGLTSSLPASWGSAGK